MSTAVIPIVEADLDQPIDIALEGVADGQRVWVELLRDGQIVGVVESPVVDGGLAIETLRLRAAALETTTVPPRTVLPDEDLPVVSVVVPTICQNSNRLQATVDHLLELNYPNFDIVVVDNRPDPNRAPLPPLSGNGRVRVFWEPHRGVSAARNCGIRNSTGEFVAFTDDDAVVDLDWLRVIGTRFVLSPCVEAVSGLVMPLELRTRAQLWFEEFFGGFNQTFSAELLSLELLANDPLFPYSTGRFGAGCNMAVRRSALERNGLFDVTLGVGTLARGGEDLALLMHQVLTGGTLAFEPRALVRHQHRETEDEFLSQVFGYGTGLTAMFTALIVDDPRHLMRMLRRLPSGLRLLTKPRGERSPSAHPSYPTRTYAYHFLGMAYGPVAYARSVARERSRRRRHRT